jgi:hypothetical protein
MIDAGPAFQWSNCGQHGYPHASVLINSLISEPIPEVMIHEQWVGLAKRRSMMRIMASLIQAATDRL